MTTLDHTGVGPLQVPGFGSIPLDYQLVPEARFAHGLVDYRHFPRLTKREMAMIQLKQRITEQPEWDRAILDSDEALLTPPTERMDIRTTSYVNNLQLIDHCQLYKHLKHLIVSSIPSWNEALFYGNTRGRHLPRILIYGGEVHDYSEEHQAFELQYEVPQALATVFDLDYWNP
ncbi:uncharacterized protein BO97DRAFT_429880 [Aspergillus homomorphus CBS 101889]|uniref:Uncharacterized protein n=1 Tax=Aspergillus homomorphus (strain CBS 101889) TaxID=1450537 RepID=A0A395HI56_ASPHC|nr:hypothetical protein BO97DRAFT_429880 [Aspergillus homomorphus CBS 101889]RAL06855.1 hypothetical protein BO97DRAFT_429880 [Aspergillus homomorphus CBS 101889]